MLQGLIAIAVALLAGFALCDFLSVRRPDLRRGVMQLLLVHHAAISVGYYWYAQTNGSDSLEYYLKTSELAYGDAWLEYYGTGTPFIRFLAFPFANYLGLTYESMMVLFSFVGFVGFLYSYAFLVEQVKSPVKLLGMDGGHLLLFLPNCHFWTAWLGKGCVIFLGIMMLFWSMNNPRQRYVQFLLGAALVYHVRPQILLIMLIAIAAGVLLSAGRVALKYRIAALIVCIPAVVAIQDSLFQTFQITEELTLEDFLEQRAASLSKGGSAIDITSYSLPEKVFAFLFRPLFVDAGGVLGMIASGENLAYLLILVPAVARGFPSYLATAPPIVKIAFLTFVGGSVALSQVTGNLGIGMRQRSQIMLLGLFAILKFKDEYAQQVNARAVSRGEYRALQATGAAASRPA